MHCQLHPRYKLHGIKVLPLCPMFGNYEWLNETKEDVIAELESEGFKRISPVFNRDGFYYNRIARRCWHEWQGTAWLGEESMFLYELKLHNVRMLTHAERQAITTLMKYRSCPPELYDTLYYHNIKIMQRNIFRQAFRWRLRDELESD